MVRQVDIFRSVRQVPLAVGVLGASAGWGTWQALSRGGEVAAILTLLLLTLLIGRDGMGRLAGESRQPSRWGWVALVAALAVVCWGLAARSEVLKNAALVLLGIGCGVFYCGRPFFRCLGPALSAALLLLPFQESIMLLLSYPLRLLSSGLTAGVLMIFRPDVKLQLTSIFIGANEIAVTDACSGIAELWALLLLAYWLRRGRRGVRGLEWLSLLVIFPVAILANAARLLLTVTLFEWWGEVVFGSAAHQLLGGIFLLLALGMLWWCLGRRKEAAVAAETEARA